jgi:hypothetical protein
VCAAIRRPPDPMEDCFQADRVRRWALTALTLLPGSPSVTRAIELCETGCSKRWPHGQTLSLVS